MTEPTTPAENADVDAAVAALWYRLRPDLLESAQVLVRGLAEGELDDAGDRAHRLAGTLGLFGLAEVADLCRRIDEALEARVAPDDEMRSAAAIVLGAVETHLQ